eukprot:2192212-Prymnesium_polylepis.1
MSRERERGPDDDGEERSRSRSPHRTHDPFVGGEGAGGGGGGDLNVRPGDWTCDNCGAHVFASKLACFRCHTPKPGFEPGNTTNGTPGGDPI